LSEAVPSIGRVNPRPGSPLTDRPGSPLTDRPGSPLTDGPAATWERLRGAAGLHTRALRAVVPAGPGCCAVCRGYAKADYRYCRGCAQHRQAAPGLLADLVVPISYSIGGTGYAEALWQYKSAAAGVASRRSARAALRLMLLVFLHDHGRCLRWSGAAPTHVAVVPSGRGCAGPHPLRALAEPYLRLPWVDLLIRPGEPVLGRDLRAGRFRAAGRLTGATVLLLDDTWTSGASAQSAAVALKLAGATAVVTVILGRHLNPSHSQVNSFTAELVTVPFRPDACAVCGTGGRIVAA
jgi:hypothetical protein